MNAFPTDEMDAMAEQFEGHFGFYVEDLNTGMHHGRDADRRFPTASVCKIPVMVELFRQSEEGGLDLSERRRLEPTISRHGTGTLSMLSDDPELTLHDYARLMFTISDNMATDMVMDAVGLDNVNATMQRMGFPDTTTPLTMSNWHYLIAGMGGVPQTLENNETVHQRLARGELDHDGIAYRDVRDNNMTTPREIATLCKRIQERQVVSRKACDAMMELLVSCTDRSMIPLHLNWRELRIAHKVGFSTRIKADTGIVCLPTGPLAIAGMTLVEDGHDDPGKETIAELARLAVEAFSPDSVAA